MELSNKKMIIIIIINLSVVLLFDKAKAEY